MRLGAFPHQASKYVEDNYPDRAVFDASDMRAAYKDGYKKGVAMALAFHLEKPKVELTMGGIAEAVCRVTGVTKEELFSQCRAREYVDARFMAAWLIHKHLGVTAKSIAKFLNRRAHVTIRHGIQLADEWQANPKLNPIWVEKIKLIEEALSEKDERQSEQNEE